MNPRLAAAVQRAVDAYPTLTEEQRGTITALLRSGGGRG